MDPDTLLAELRELTAAADDPGALAARFADLDAWLARGGFLPAAWTAGRA